MTSMVYIRTNHMHTTLYTGVTSDGEKRDAQHRSGQGGVFSNKYAMVKLVWYQQYEDIRDAIHREKQIKAGSRAKKIALIEAMNPEWSDLGEDWQGRSLADCRASLAMTRSASKGAGPLNPQPVERIV
ncbi:MAG: GIY-YIG nuclease family protein [Alphaproteobacteria bacterium]